jgi:hypothetical protein
MFPNRDVEKLAEVLCASEGSLTEAVDTLLCEEQGTIACDTAEELSDEDYSILNISLDQPCSSSSVLTKD